LKVLGTGENVGKRGVMGGQTDGKIGKVPAIEELGV
jgi:hypothetical protein